jgi:hypothetical protein
MLVFDCSENSGAETAENVINILLHQDEETSVRNGRDVAGS